MSTRASAPRCASCGMPLAPDAESCAVCGARVPLIARPAAGEEEPADEPLRSAPAPLPPSPRASEPPAWSASPSMPAAPPRPANPFPAAPTPSAGRGAAPFDASAAARDVRAATRPASGVVDDDAPSIGVRVAAYAIDVLTATAAGLVGVLVMRVTDGAAAVVPGLLGLGVGVAQVVAEGRAGTTLGARVLGLRTVDAATGGAPGVGRAFLRQLLLGLGVLVCLVGNWVVAASAAWDSGPARRGWHDKASGTTVVRAGARTAAPAPGGPQRPWTPSAPATGPVRPARGPAGELGGVAVPPPGPAVPPPAVVPVVPDLLPPAPVSGVDPTPAAPAAADLLPPPPAAPARTVPAPAGPGSPGAAVPSFVDPADDLAELEHTRVRDPESLRRRTGTLALHFDTGERVRVVGRGLVGRGPRAEDGEDILHVVALNDAARSLSRVHAEFGPHPATAPGEAAIWVSDRGSTNGTVVVDPSGSARVLPAGAKAVVGAGWVVRLGDREARVVDD